MKKNRQKSKFKFNIYLFLIMFSFMFMSMGFAAISNTTFSVTGNAVANVQSGVFISDVNCTDNTGTSATVNGTNKTTLNSTISLSSTNSNSTITCTVTIYNNTNKKYLYDDTVYDESFYDNNRITFTPDITHGTSLNSKSSVTFNVTFKYASGSTPSGSNNTLNSYLNFRFIKAPWYESCNSSSSELNCKMITNSTPSSDSSINFNANSSASNGRGLYYTADTSRTEDMDNDGYGDRIYYYRGNVSNNYVIFDSYCWRIVRTNEDGSIKLIYGGTPSNGSCSQSGTNVNIGSGTFNSSTTKDNALVGYMYGSTGASSYANAHRNTNSSTIKTTIDNWYNTNLSDSASYLADYRFCADRTLKSGNGYGTSTSVYAPEDRFYANSSNQVPNIKCNQDNDKFTVSSSNGNGALTYPIGLLTADEANYAGVRYSTSGTNNDSFLYTSAYYWLLSPGDLDSNGVYIFVINNSGNMRLNVGSSTSTTIYIRPVINLLPSVAWESGTGTYNNPYIVNGIASDDPGGNTEPENPDPPTPSSDLWYEKCTSESNTLNCKMITLSTPNSDEDLSFSSFSSSSNGRGLYYTSDTSKTEDLNNDGTGERVYYYRGAVTNNFLLLGNVCWRILRTNEDGTIRLIYGGTPSNGSCPQNGTAVSIGSSAFNTNNNDNAYVGYMYGTAGSSSYEATHRNTNNSTIKTTVDNWFRNNFTSYTSYLADEVFCNDRKTYSGDGYGTSSTYYMGYNRVNTNKSPSFVCIQDNDKFTVNSSNGNGALTYPIGLITADELNFAGSTYNASGSTTDHFLYTGENLWTMTPSDYYENEFYVLYMYSNGNIRLQYSVSNSNPVRPVINLLSNIVVSSGTGTYNSPFQVTLPS